MKKTILFTFIVITLNLFSQDLLDVTDQTIKVDGKTDHELFYGFAEGDVIFFNFIEKNNKAFKEIEIVEYPSNIKYSGYEIKKLEDKQIQINKKGIYIFRFKNESLTSRTIEIKIQRKPISDATKQFNSSIRWEVKYDTIWNIYSKDIIIGYDTLYLNKSKKVLIKTELKESLILDKTQTVHSNLNSKGTKSEVFFTLPDSEISDLATKEVVSWGYWVGVNEEGSKAWNSNLKTVTGLATKAASAFISPLGALAVGVVGNLLLPSTGQDIIYCVTDEKNRNLFWSGYEYRIYDEGRGAGGYKLFNSKGLLNGKFFVLLKNDNEVVAVNVNIKVSVMFEIKTYEIQKYIETQINPKYEKKIFREPKITSTKIPVNVN